MDGQQPFEVATVWQDYERRLRAFLASRLDNPADADDVLQDVLIKVHRALPTLRAPEKLGSWLFQITRNALADHARRRPAPESTDAAPAVPPQETGQARRELARCVRPLVDQLPPLYRDALVAADLEGGSQRDLATQFGVSHSAMKSRVQRGRAMLKRIFETCCRYETDRRGNVIDYEARDGECRPDACPAEPEA